VADETKTNGNGNGNGGYPDGTPTWLKIAFIALQKFGIATLILLVGGWWLASHVGDPLIVSYTEAIRLQTKIVAEQSDNIKAIKEFEAERVRLVGESNRAWEKALERSSSEHTIMLENSRQALSDHQAAMKKLEHIEGVLPAAKNPG
jgi:hypothetical protein